MNAYIRYTGGLRFETVVRGHRVTTDQPVENGGRDAGPTPPELLLASLGTCAGHYAAEYLAQQGLSAEGLSLQVFADRGKNPTHIQFFRVEATVPQLDEVHREGVLNAIRSCLIHTTLRMSPKIDIQVEFAHAGEELVAAG